MALTGTPVENRLAELHAVLDFANPGLFGSAAGLQGAVRDPGGAAPPAPPWRPNSSASPR
ncbi:SNF2-related protein, partial [Streptomyces lusitanus]|uniref:SNF2-related protein n=1 Tax=Streptomyces lusitanus TaxID=68232 RepID=UPI00363AFF46